MIQRTIRLIVKYNFKVMSGNTVQTDPKEKFEGIMGAMKNHYQMGTGVPYVLHPTTSYDAIQQEIPLEAKEATANFNTATNTFTVEQQNTLNKKTEEYAAKNLDQDAFVAQMNLQKEKAKMDANERIDNYYAQMIKVGKENPQAQSAILVLSRNVSHFFNELLKKIQDFVVELASKIAQWVMKALDKIQDFFGSTSASISEFFGGLFSSGVA